MSYGSRRVPSLLGTRPSARWLGERPALRTLAPSEVGLQDAKHIYRDRDGSLHIRFGSVFIAVIVVAIGRPTLDLVTGNLNKHDWSDYAVEIVGAMVAAIVGIVSEYRKFSK